MNTLLQTAFEKASRLPDDEQGQIANALLVVLDGSDQIDEAEEREWDALVSSPKSLAWLEQQGAEVSKEIKAGKALPFDPSDLKPK